MQFINEHMHSCNFFGEGDIRTFKLHLGLHSSDSDPAQSCTMHDQSSSPPPSVSDRLQTIEEKLDRVLHALSIDNDDTTSNNSSIGKKRPLSSSVGSRSTTYEVAERSHSSEDSESEYSS